MGCGDSKIIKSETKAKDYLRSKGVLDRYNNILNLKNFRKQHRIIRDSANEKYGIDTQWFVEENGGKKALPITYLFKAVDDFNNSPDYGGKEVDDFLYEMEETQSSNRGSAYVKIQEGLISSLETKKLKIKHAGEIHLSEGNIEEYKKALEKENEIQRYLEDNEEGKGLKSIVRDIKSGNINYVLEMRANEDLARIKMLVESKDLKDNAQALKLIEYYEDLADFQRENKTEHPFYTQNEIKDRFGNIILSDREKNQIIQWAETAKEQRGILNTTNRKRVMEVINANTKVIAAYGDKGLTSEQVFKDIGDTSLVDMFLMDATHGIFSNNGILPQIMLNELRDDIDRKRAWATDKEKRINDLLPQVREYVENKPGGTYRKKGLFGIPGTSFQFFQQKTKLGKLTGNLINRFTADYSKEKERVDQKYQDAKAAAFRAYHLDKDIAQTIVFEGDEKRSDSPGNKLHAALQKAERERKAWYDENVEILDFRKIPEILKIAAAEDPTDENHQILSLISENFASIEEAETYKADFIRKHGRAMYETLVEEQIHNLNRWIVKGKVDLEAILKVANESRKERARKDAEETGGVFEAGEVEEVTMQNMADLLTPEEYKAVVHSLKKISPEITLQNYLDNEAPSVWYKNENGDFYEQPLATVTTDFNVTFPKKEDSYDKDYKELENYEAEDGSKPLLEFHSIAEEILQVVQATLPVGVQKRIMTGSIPAMERGIREAMLITFAEEEGWAGARVWAAFRTGITQFHDEIFGLMGAYQEDNLSNATKGKTEVSRSWYRQNKKEITQLFNISVKEFVNAYNAAIVNPNEEFIKDFKQKGGIINTENINASQKRAIANALNVSVASLPKVVNMGAALYEDATHEIVSSQTINLPKILKAYSVLAMEYAARVDQIDKINLLKEQYKLIKAGVDDEGNPIERTNSVKQIEAWFDRIALGDYSTKEDPMLAKIKNNLITDNAKKVVENIGERTTITSKAGKLKYAVKLTAAAISHKVNGRIRTEKEKKIADRLNDLVKQAKDRGDEEEVKSLIKDRDSIGKAFAWIKLGDAVFNFIRLKGLGWNASAAITNFAEGQQANLNIAATGDYFREENIYVGLGIAKGAFAHNISGGRLARKGKSRLMRTLMDRYKILQDASNLMQAAQSETGFSGVKDGSWAPFEIVTRVEYLNQAPLMVAVLLDQKIKDINGVEMSVWDAMDSKDYSKGQLRKEFRIVYDSKGNAVLLDDVPGYKETGKLPMGYKTGENIKSWEQAEGQSFQNFKGHLDETIVNAHGDYSDLRGNMASERALGRLLMFFKKWFGRQMYTRFAGEQVDLETNTLDFKGRYRSHTSASAFLHGTLAGFSVFGAGVPSLVIGGVAGIGFMGSDTKSDLSLLKQGSLILKGVAKKMIGIPVNFIGEKEYIKGQDFSSMLSENFNERDVKNMQSLVTDLSLQLSWIALRALFKWTLDDEECEGKGCEAKKMIHNVLVNRALTLSQQGAQYVNAIGIWDMFFVQNAVLGWANDVWNFATQFETGDATLKTGPNMGENKNWNRFQRAFLPAPAKNILGRNGAWYNLKRGNWGGAIPTLGFESQMQREFYPQRYDTGIDRTKSFLFPKKYKAKSIKLERDKIAKKRARVKADMRARGKTEKEISDFLRLNHPYP